MRAADILDDNGAIDVDKRDSRYRSSLEESGKSPASVGSSSQHTSGSARRDYNNPIVTRHESEYASSRNMDRQTDEDFRELPRVEERSGPGVGTEPTAGKRSRSRINKWQGEASSRLREDRDSETKIGW